MNFLEAVNLVLREEGVIRGDDDDLTSFSETQHSATLQLAQIAVQSELASFVSDRFIDYEDASATLTLASGTRLYDLDSSFVRMREKYLLYTNASDVSEGSFLVFKDEHEIRNQFLNYREDTGRPVWVYFPGGTTKKVGFYPVPDDTYYLRYYFEKDVSVSVETDVLPFITTTQAQIFTHVAARHFKWLFAKPDERIQLFQNGLEKDPIILQNKAILAELLRGTNPPTKYGYGRT